MRLEYESTLDDVVHAHLMTMRRARSIFRTRIWNALVAGGVAGIVVAFIINDTLAVELIFAAGAGTVAAISQWFYSKRQMIGNLRKYATETRGTKESIRTSVHVDETEITMAWLGMKLSCAWPSINVIDRAPNYVEITGLGGFSLVIPSRAFPDEAARTEFVDQARRYRANAGGLWSRVGHRQCPSCGYDLHFAESDRCPECGDMIPVAKSGAVT